MDKVQQRLDAAGIDGSYMARMVAKIAKDELPGHKGILLLGGVGTGKTVRLGFIADLLGIRGRIECKQLVRCVLANSDPDYYRQIIRVDYGRWTSEPDAHEYDLVVDELGREQATASTYGNKVDAIADMIEDRYKAFKDCHCRKAPYGWKTHFASNLTEPQIKEYYGDHIYSRLKEMCIFFNLPGKDRRMLDSGNDYRGNL